MVNRFTTNLGIALQAAPTVAKLKKATSDLEGVFVKDLIGVMRRSIPKASLGQGYGTEIYDDLFNQAIADSVSKSGTFGFGSMLFRQLSPNAFAQEVQRLAREAADSQPNPSTSDIHDLTPKDNS